VATKTVIDADPCCRSGVEGALFASGDGALEIAQHDAVPAVTPGEDFMPISIWAH